MMNFLKNFLAPKPEAIETPEAPVATEAPAETEANIQELTMTESTATEEAKPETTTPETTMPERPMLDDNMNPYSDPYADPSMEMEEFETTLGESLIPGGEIADDDAVVEAMRSVYDPEIPVNIYDLGLIYNFKISEVGDVKVEMSLTAPGCPVAGEMPGMVSEAVSGIDGIGIVTTRIVWDPAWTPELMSEDAKLALGMF